MDYEIDGIMYDWTADNPGITVHVSTLPDSYAIFFLINNLFLIF